MLGVFDGARADAGPVCRSLEFFLVDVEHSRLALSPMAERRAGTRESIAACATCRPSRRPSC